jgi:RNA polymerase sigma-70 factor (ECF subfamily)
VPSSSQTLPTLTEFESWVDDYTPALVAFAHRRLRDLRLAEDAVQETFLAAWSHRHAFEGRSTVRTWLTGILRRKVVDTIRRENRLPPLLPDEQNLDEIFDTEEHYRFQTLPWVGIPDQDYARREFRQNLRTCLDDLPPRLAQVFTLREVDGLAKSEICSTLKISSSNYWVMLHRARMKLRNCLESLWLRVLPEGSR